MKLGLGRKLVRRVRKKKAMHHHTPVTEPSKSELAVFGKHAEGVAKGIKHPHALIVGASPELRDITADFEMRTTVLADNLEIIESTADVMKKRNEKERWLEGDIRSLPLRKSSFDLVMSDQIVPDSPPFDKGPFYKRIRDLVKKRGRVILRPVMVGGTEKKFEKMISRYFRIGGKEFGREGIFSRHFPIYLLKRKR